jgi:hypothetical protein
MAELFAIDRSGISRHINNIYETGELRREATVAKFATVENEGSRFNSFLSTKISGYFLGYSTKYGDKFSN